MPKDCNASKVISYKTNKLSCGGRKVGNSKECSKCHKIVSRKSFRRHVSLHFTSTDNQNTLKCPYCNKICTTYNYKIHALGESKIRSIGCSQRHNNIPFDDRQNLPVPKGKVRCEKCRWNYSLQSINRHLRKMHHQKEP